MTLRTPRRRISPRTKRRYRAIREFFRRALGSSSQPDIKISSSIAVNVTDLKRKINGLEQQLDEVNKHCQDIACLDCSKRQSDCYLQSGREVQDECSIKEYHEPSSERKSNGIETQLIYKSSESNGKKFEDSEYVPKTHDDTILTNEQQGMVDEYDRHDPKVKNKKSKLDRISEYSSKLHKYRTRSVYENFTTAYSTSSFRSLTNPRMNQLNAGYSGQPSDRKHLKHQEYTESITPFPRKEKKQREHMKRNKTDYVKETYEQKPNKVHKHKHSHSRELDQDFIADIIKRQYKPVKLFGRKESDLSQISAPVCRDQEFSLREDIQEGTELCSCCYDPSKHIPKRKDFNEMRSICDTRLYSCKKHARSKHRKMYVDMYNNSDLYDLVPVKEKSSPKTRRKFNEDNLIPYDYYREVPPSPRTLRPRLNLKAQYNSEFDDYMAQVKRSHRKSYKSRRHREFVDSAESNITSEPTPIRVIEHPRKSHKHIKCQVNAPDQCLQESCTGSSIRHAPPENEHNEQTNLTIGTTLNKTQENVANNKTDKALCEIKDILQNFLHEIKKETIACQCDKSDVTSKTGGNSSNGIRENSANTNINEMPNSRHSFNNFGGAQCNRSPFIAPFTNPCCYPILPMCPINCPMSMQNGYLMPSQSYTCTNCAKEPAHTEHSCNKNMHTNGTCHAETCHTETCLTETCRNDHCHTETEELIKEIYKFVAQSPVRKRDFDDSSDSRHGCRKMNHRILTSRSVGESSKLSKHDAKVGTTPLKCYSKSCEAIGSRIGSDAYYSNTNPSFSDTILEKLSLEVTQSSTENDLDAQIPEDKSRPNKLSKVLRSIGLFKKKKRDVIEELSESESTLEVDLQPKSPYRQEITNYMMHGHEYFQPPPIPSNYQRPNEYQQDYHPPYNPGVPEYLPSPPIHDLYGPRTYNPRLREQASAPPFHPKHGPTAPPYHSAYEHYNQMPSQPQVPLCLKEIEVKSIGTQSERKVSIFKQIKKRMQPPMSPAGGGDDYNQLNNCSTQTQTTQAKPSVSVKTPPKPLFNWKSLQAKAQSGKNDAWDFGLKAQKDLAAGDQKIRKAMIKKLFHKRNPFSPRNLIVKTLLGKDKSSYGDPPNMSFKPRIFF